MSRGACILVIGSYLAVGGLGFVEVSCLCAERHDCVLPIAEACALESKDCDDCGDCGAPAMSASDCPCGPCLDLLSASNLLLDAPAADVVPGIVEPSCCTLPEPVRLALSWSTPAGPSPPILAHLPILRC